MFMRVLCLAVTAVSLITGTLSAQIMYTGGTTYTQDFNSLANTPEGSDIAWTDNVTLVGWYNHVANRPDTYRASDGNHDTGHVYSFGATGSTERALGSIATSSTGTLFWGVRLRNNHPTWTLTSFTVSYTMEQWRVAANTAVHTTFFQYKLSTTDTDINGGGYTGVSAGDLVSVTTSTTASALNGNDPANQSNHNFTVTGINWAPGTDLWLRWRDPNNDGTDHGMAIDDFSFSAVPEPTTLALVGLGMVSTAVLGRKLRRNKSESLVAGA
jgi:hypothetical protein